MNKPGDARDPPDHDEHRGITVETLSSPPVQIKPASLVKRTLAGILDSIVLVAIWGAILFSNRQGFSSAIEWRASRPFAYLAVLVFVYYFFLEGLLSATGEASARASPLRQERRHVFLWRLI
jgi:hypothetical protein